MQLRKDSMRVLQMLLLMGMLLLGKTQAEAQRHEVLSDRIASLQVVAGGDWMSLPVLTMGSGERLSIDFDDLTHEYHRYVYKVEHCEADWTVSEDIFVSDYIAGFNDGQPIDDLEESLNTNVLYTHYRLKLPNAQCRMKLSGNYQVTIYDEDDEDEPVLRVCFMMVEPLMGVAMGVTTNTDIDINNAHQQVEMQLSYGKLLVTDQQRQLKIVVMQNGRWDNAVWNPTPQFAMSDGLRWQHCRDLIFAGGNEYRKFEMLDVTHTTMGLESVHWDGQAYHAYIWPDEPRPSYVYDEDANGAFLIRNSDNFEIDRTSEYMLAHFTLPSPEVEGTVYLNGNWTNDRFLPEYALEYNPERHAYEAVIPLKQGYYSYQYLLMRDDGTLEPFPTEGCFYQTENVYQALVYYRGIGERTDRLVGYGRVSTR